jgi:adenylate kinase family enzyme
MKIIIFGASGVGTTTLENEIDKWTNFKHLDVDTYYWKKTESPFQEKTELEKPNTTLKTRSKPYTNVIHNMKKCTLLK